MNTRISILFIILSILTYAQKPKENFFRSPLDIPIVLAGTFAELRPDHFHGGIDIKTKQREGLAVYATADGFVSRIKVALFGYGKAIYIDHANGTTTVYAHLQKYSPRINAIVKSYQYSKEKFEVEMLNIKDSIKVKKGEIIAYSGSTGGFIAPHLHYEIRHSKSQKPINPFLFGMDVSDTTTPIVRNVMAYSFSESGHVNKLNSSKLSLRKINKDTYKCIDIYAYGKVSFGLNTYDLLDNATNKNGVYGMEMTVNGKLKYSHKMDSFAFNNSKYINQLIDYKKYKINKTRYQKTYIESFNFLGIYDKTKKTDYINVEEGKKYNVDIRIFDYKGNETSVHIGLIGRKGSYKDKNSQYSVDRKVFNEFSDSGVKAAFPKYTFYKDLDFNFKVNGKVVKVHNSSVALNKRYTLTFDTKQYSTAHKKQLYIAKIGYKKKWAVRFHKKENKIYASLKHLGNYILLRDSISPRVKMHNFSNNRYISKYKTLKVKISDIHSGVSSYDAFIDGKWILMEYNIKKGYLVYNLKDKILSIGKHVFKIVVSDKVGNTTTKKVNIYKGDLSKLKKQI